MTLAIQNDSILEATKKRALKAQYLMIYATDSGLAVDDAVIDKIDAAVKADSEQLLEMRSSLDKAIRDLSTLTYPTTIETVSEENVKLAQHQLTAISHVALLALAVGMISAAFIRLRSDMTEDYIKELFPSMLAASLGLLGAITYLYFNFIGVISEKAFSRFDSASNRARLFLGMSFGWIFYFLFCRRAYSTISSGYDVAPLDAILMCVPFLAGFSTRLVIGVLNFAVRSAESALGLQSKSQELKERDARARRTDTL